MLIKSVPGRDVVSALKPFTVWVWGSPVRRQCGGRWAGPCASCASEAGTLGLGQPQPPLQEWHFGLSLDELGLYIQSEWKGHSSWQNSKTETGSLDNTVGRSAPLERRACPVALGTLQSQLTLHLGKVLARVSSESGSWGGKRHVCPGVGVGKELAAWEGRQIEAGCPGRGNDLRKCKDRQDMHGRGWDVVGGGSYHMKVGLYIGEDEVREMAGGVRGFLLPPSLFKWLTNSTANKNIA